MAVRIDGAARRMEVSVGDLLPADEVDPFAPARAGFARMLAGVRAHGEYARSALASDPAYEREVVLRRVIDVDDWKVEVWGRVDGLVREPAPAGGGNSSGGSSSGGNSGGIVTVVEEVKSVVLAEEAFAALGADSYPAYALQLRIYLYLLSLSEGAGERAPVGRLVFVNLPGGAVRSVIVELDRESIRALVLDRARQLIAAWMTEAARLERRRALASRLTFPFPERRPHQGDLEAAARRAFDQGECLLASAPPGLGKTAAVLSAALAHALASDRRVWFVTAKTTEQRIVATTLGRLTAEHPELSAVVLRAKAKICTNDVVVCHPEFCEFARDYPAKVAATRVRERLLEGGLALPDLVRAQALLTRACPFEISLDLAERADVVVGDYNYVFDPVVSLRREFESGPSGDLVLVIDEAHNLLDRAREYYSPSLDSRRVEELKRLVELRPGAVYRALEEWLDRLLALFPSLVRRAEESEDAAPLGDPTRRQDGIVYRVGREDDEVGRRRAELEAILLDYFVLRRSSGSVAADDPVLALAFEFLRFARVMDLEGDEFVYLLEAASDGGCRYRIVCLDPSRHLGRRLRSFHAVVAMSATLSPESYYRELLGFPPERTSSIAIPSPFPRENRQVLIAPLVETTFRERARWYDETAAIVARTFAAGGGHWIAFLPSFAYLRELEARLALPREQLLVQSESMDERDRREVLERLERPDGTARLLLAVLGGSFAEGIDLPGDALVGVIVVSPGLPQVSIERELLKRYFDQRRGDGFDFAYLVPGVGRVVQAAGRLVRSETDRGVVVLLDRRFASSTYNRFLPRDWYEKSPQELVTRDPAGEVARFFAAGASPRTDLSAR